MRFDLPQRASEAGPNVLLLAVAGTADREVALRFVQADGSFVVLAPRTPSPNWAHALMSGRPITWRVDGRRIHGAAEVVQDPEALAAIVRGFESVFGERDVRRWFGDAVIGFRLHEGTTAMPEYHAEIARYFDHLAPSYDAAVESNALDLRLRAVSRTILARAFRTGDRVLEIGCGTGLETLPLARLGVRIVATDISGGMLEQLRSKAASEGLAPQIEMRRLAARDLGALLDELGAGSFDGAFSDFGALNCEPEWGELPRTLHALIRPDGPLILGIWNRYCAAEAILSTAAGTPRRALGRLEDPVPVGRSRYGVPVFARAPSEVLASLRPFFSLTRLTGLPVFLPPYDFQGSLRGRVGLLALLGGLDSRLADKFPFNRVGDHFIAELRRRP